MCGCAKKLAALHSRSSQAVAITTLLATCLFVGLSNVQAQQQKLLRWKLKPGETIQVDFSQDMSMLTSLRGTEIKTAADMGMTLVWNVAAVSPEGVAEISQSIERLKMSMENPGSPPIEYDSSAPGEPEGIAKTLATSVKPLVGVKFVQQMSNRGEILDVQLSEEAQAHLAKTPAGPQLKQVFSKEGLKSLLNQAATVLPEQPVKPGDTWQGKTETKSPVGTLVMDMNYTYQGTVMREERPLEQINVDISVGFGEGPNPLGLNVTVADQKNTGSMFFDAVAGRFVDSELRQDMTLVTAVGDKTHRQKLATLLRMQFASVNAHPPGTRVGERPTGATTPQPATVR